MISVALSLICILATYYAWQLAGARDQQRRRERVARLIARLSE